jgi:Tfp pilus assembly protein PilN
MELMRPRRSSSVLALALEGSRLEGVELRRTNGSLHLRQRFSASLALSPLNADPQLVGREIRNHLEHAGVRERRCVVCLPLNWALTAQIKLPDLPEADLASLLELEVERAFPYAPDALRIAQSRCRTPRGEQVATLVAVPKNHVEQLERALRAAQLKPQSFTLGVSALQSPTAQGDAGQLALAIGEESVELQVSCGGGVAALRALDGAVESQGAQKRFYADLLARELRITLGQLPPEVGGSIREIQVFGCGDAVARLLEDLTPRARALGLDLRWVRVWDDSTLPCRPPAETPPSPALGAGARHLAGAVPLFEFLPPRTSPWQQVVARFSSRKLAWGGAAAGALLVLVGGAWLVQQWQLSRLQAQWTAMRPKVQTLETMQQRIKAYRPWFDDSFRTLRILRQVTEAFPEEGTVTAKTLEIRGESVACTGVARDNVAFLKVHQQLQASGAVGSLKVDLMRGKTPMEFTFNFRWQEGAPGED